MKKFFCCCLLAVVASVTVSAQITDSLGKVCLVPAAREGGFARYIDRRTSTKGYRMTFIAVPLIVGGAVMSVYDTDFRRLRNGYVKSFHHDYDDYLQYAPAAVMLGLKAFGVKGRSSWGRMLVSDAFSVGLMAAAVNSLKYSFRVMRPDGSTRNSFPSGHTATVFMTATMLHKEYGHRSPWYSIGAYTVATVTGVTRQLNNRHWMSDVMVGAGIGILHGVRLFPRRPDIQGQRAACRRDPTCVRPLPPAFVPQFYGRCDHFARLLFAVPGDEDFVQGRAYGRGAGGMVRLALCRRGRAFCRDEPRDDRQWRAAGR